MLDLAGLRCAAITILFACSLPAFGQGRATQEHVRSFISQAEPTLLCGDKKSASIAYQWLQAVPRHRNVAFSDPVVQRAHRAAVRGESEADPVFIQAAGRMFLSQSVAAGKVNSQLLAENLAKVRQEYGPEIAGRSISSALQREDLDAKHVVLAFAHALQQDDQVSCWQTFRNYLSGIDPNVSELTTKPNQTALIDDVIQEAVSDGRETEAVPSLLEEVIQQSRPGPDAPGKYSDKSRDPETPLPNDAFSLQRESKRVKLESDSQGFPEVVYIHAKLQTEPGNKFCGGVLISASWVLTAAHCLHSHTAQLAQEDDVTIYLHKEARRALRAIAGTAVPAVIKSNLREIHIPKDYFSILKNKGIQESTLHDVALLKLTTPFNISSKSTLSANTPANFIATLATFGPNLDKNSTPDFVLDVGWLNVTRDKNRLTWGMRIVRKSDSNSPPPMSLPCPADSGSPIYLTALETNGRVEEYPDQPAWGAQNEKRRIVAVISNAYQTDGGVELKLGQCTENSIGQGPLLSSHLDWICSVTTLYCN